MAGTTDSLRSLWSRIARKAEDTANELLLDSYRDQVADARHLLSVGDPAAAAEVLEALLREKPDHVAGLTLLGAARLALGTPGPAESAFERALAERGGDPHARVGMGQALVSLGRAAEAVPHLARGVEESRGDRTLLAAAYLALGRAWRAQGELDKAIRELRKAVAEAPDDVDARTELALALLDDTRTSSTEARRHLERAAEAEPAPAAALAALGRLALDDEMPHAAGVLFERARVAALATHGPEARHELSDALIGLGDVARAQHLPETAHLHYLEALELEPRRAEIHARLAALAVTVGDQATAVGAYERALAMGAGVETLIAAVEVAHNAGDRDRAVRWANDLLAQDGRAPIAIAARAAEMIDNGQLDAADALLRGAEASVAVAIERARIARARDPGPAGAAAAANAALAALAIDAADPRARELLRRARADQLAVPAEDPPEDPSGDAGFLPRAAALERALATRADLASMVGEVARATAELEQPLLVTVMGEFSSGKSSFVNAFIGADVAATGITPTTATINVVKYGHERGGRVIFADGRSQTLSWDELHPFLRGISDADARGIDRVEICLPLDRLAKIHLVDTPGLNSILPEHEDTARAFIGRADAVVWVFTAAQGGKASERKALDAIRAQGKRVLGVLNKCDQLSPEEVAEVVAHVTAELGERVEVIVPFSARRALTARTGGAAADDGNWSALEGALEERFFAQARRIKRDACARRLLGVIDLARGFVDRDRGRFERQIARVHEAREELDAFAARAADEVVAPIRRELAVAIDALYRRAAREVIELVRPRQLPFGSHSATPADRDYLLALLDDGYEAALNAAELQLMSLIGRPYASAMSTVHETFKFPAGALMEPFSRAHAYVSGFLAGGAVDSFFRNDLPRLALEADTVYHALFRAAPDLEWLIADPLATAIGGAIADVASEMDRQSRAAEVAIFDLDVGLGAALDTLASQFRRT